MENYKLYHNHQNHENPDAKFIDKAYLRSEKSPKAHTRGNLKKGLRRWTIADARSTRSRNAFQCQTLLEFPIKSRPRYTKCRHHCKYQQTPPQASPRSPAHLSLSVCERKNSGRIGMGSKSVALNGAF